VGQRGMGGGGAYQGLVGTGGSGESSSAGVRGWGAGGVITNIGDSAVNNVALIRGTHWGMKSKGRQGLGGGWHIVVRTFWEIAEEMLGRGNV